MSTPRPKREFSDQYKADAVNMVLELGKSRAQAARDLGINESTLGKWVSKATGTEGSGRGSHLCTPNPEPRLPRPEPERDGARDRTAPTGERVPKKSRGLLREGTVTTVLNRLRFSAAVMRVAVLG